MQTTNDTIHRIHTNDTSFRDLNLLPPLLKNVAREGYETTTPVQAMAIPPILARRDIVGSAPTGTGKTAAFTLPMVQRLVQTRPDGPRRIRGLVLAPTRELAGQIADSLRVYGRGMDLRHVTIFGGVGQHKQVRALRDGVDIVIATPGRLMDLMEQREVDLRHVEILVLDEADRMLDMGFIPAVRKIAGFTPPGRQTLLFSATIPPTIKKLVSELLQNPERVAIEAENSAADKIEQGVFFVKKADKPDLLAHVIDRYDVDCGIVFSRTKHGADRVVKQLQQRGIEAVAIHGNKNQNQRQRALDGFKKGRVPILVATDVAARGIDVDGITHVINYDLTHEPETYVHRIGRTGRAGADGIALSFCDGEERAYLRDIQKLIGREIDVFADHPFADGPQRVPMPRAPQGPSGRKSGRPERALHPLEKPAKPKAAATGSPVKKSSKKSPRPAPGNAAPGGRKPYRGPAKGGKSRNRRQTAGAR